MNFPQYYAMILDFNNPNCWLADSAYLEDLPKQISRIENFGPREQKVLVIAGVDEFENDGKPTFNVIERTLLATAAVKETKQFEISNMANVLASTREAVRETMPDWIQVMSEVIVKDQTIQVEVAEVIEDWLKENPH